MNLNKKTLVSPILPATVGQLRLKWDPERQVPEGANCLNPAWSLCVLGKLLGHSEPQFAHRLHADVSVGTK